MPEDQLNQSKSIYTAGAGEVFWKNFLAGFGRALGGMLIYGIFLVISVYYFIVYAYPKITPFIQEYQQAIQSLNTVNGLKTTTVQGSSPAQLQQYQQMLKDITPAK